MEIDRSKLPYRQGVIGFVKNKDGQYLIFNNPDWEDDKWRMPGGGLQPGEDYVGAIKRELKEEFNLEITEINKTSQFVNQYEWSDELVEKNIAKGNYFRGQQQKQVLISLDNDPEIKIDPREIKKYLFVYPEEFSTYLIFPGQLEMTLKVINEFENE